MSITVGELKRQLEGLNEDAEIDFGSTAAAVRLIFYRVKRGGNDDVMIELNEDFPEPGTYSVTVSKDMGSLAISAPHLK